MRVVPEPRVDGRTLRFQHRRPEILEAVMEHVLEHGLGDVSLRSLAAAVGVSHVTLRHHFGSKEELVAEIFDEIRARQEIPADIAAEDGAALLRRLWEAWTGERGLRQFRLLFEAYGQALMAPDRYRRFLDGVVGEWLAIIEAWALAAGCPPDEAPRFATLLIAQLRGLALDLLATGDRARVDAAFDDVVDDAERRRAAWAVSSGSRA
jgi:AcrR family transcriptional regulator